MTAGPTTWDCDAYGAEGTAMGALCFFAPNLGERVCHTATDCTGRMNAERQRIFERINELAAGGDPAWTVLAQEITDPAQLLGGGGGSRHRRR